MSQHLDCRLVCRQKLRMALHWVEFLSTSVATLVIRPIFHFLTHSAPVISLPTSKFPVIVTIPFAITLLFMIAISSILNQQNKKIRSEGRWARWATVKQNLHHDDLRDRSIGKVFFVQDKWTFVRLFLCMSELHCHNKVRAALGPKFTNYTEISPHSFWISEINWTTLWRSHIKSNRNKPDLYICI